jgi:hypothetical protein
MLLAGRERLLQFWPVIALAALDLGEVLDKRPPAAVEIILNGLSRSHNVGSGGLGVLEVLRS